MLQRQLGNITINRILESEEPNFDPLAFFPQTSPDDWGQHRQWLQPHPLSPALGYLTLTMQSYLLRTQHHTILVDTCVGDHKKRQGAYTPPGWNHTTGGVLLKSLAAAGVHPEEIDYVMCTHLHSDHVGWNTRLGVPTFPNAKYIMSRRELNHWQAIHLQRPLEQLTDSILPVLESGQAVLVTNDYALDDEVWLESTPGHTPDHFSVCIASHGNSAVITGDMMHSPVQCMKPHWVSRFDSDPVVASQTRLAFLERHCDARTLICGTHFPSPSFGHIAPGADGFQFAYQT